MKSQQLKQKHKQLMTIFNRLGIDSDQRHEIIYCFTGGRTSSTRELTEDELLGIVWKFQQDFNFSQGIQPDIELQKRKKRSEVLTIAQRCGIHSGKDFVQFNGFMLNRSVCKKELYKYNLQELDELIKQFRGLERHYRSSAANPGTKAYNREKGFAQVSNN